MRKFASILLVICTLLALCGCSKDSNDEEDNVSSTVEGKGFKSPEKAILAYAEALQSGDVKKILSTFAMETYVENLDMEEYLHQVSSYVISMGLVSGDDYSREIRLVQRQYDITRLLGYLYMNHSERGIPENLEPVPVPPSSRSEYETMDEFIDDMTVEDWAEILEEMEIGDVLEDKDIIPDKLTEGYYDNLERLADRYGCDEIVPLAVEITLDGKDYYLCVNVANYDGTWYNLAPMGMIATVLGADSMSCGLVER